jgi:hypothetical protein
LSIFATKGLGLIFRGFAKDPAKVPERAARLIAAVRHAAEITIDGEPAYRRIVIAVPVDRRYPDHDCGELVRALSDPDLPPHICNRLFVLAIEGDYICDALNESVDILYRGGCSYAHIVSTAALDFVNDAELLQADRAFAAGAKVFGLAFDELAPLVLEGFVQNTWAIWNIHELRAYGGFDRRAAQRPNTDDRYGLAGGPSSGVEEIIPLCHFVKRHGASIAVAPPKSMGVWKVPDPNKDPEGAKRHREKMASKLDRIAERLAQAGYPPDFITKNGVMDL